MNKIGKLLILIFALLISALPLCSCAGTSAEGISIVTTIFAPYDFAKAIGGENVSVKMLLSPGADIHSYDPTPKDMLALKKCDIFICVGGTSDAWAEEILASVENEDIVIIKLMEHTEGLICSDHSHEDEDHGHGHDHDHGEFDEHVWTSPRNAALACEAIADALCALDAENAETYRSNFSEYSSALSALDEEIKSIVAGAARTEIVFGDRFPLIYFANAYGLTYHSAFPGCAGDTEPSASTIAELMSKVKINGIPAVFCLGLSQGNIADTICAETGAKKLVFHSCENVSKNDFRDGVTYLELMQRNAQALREALS
jgi:zinc transport system substrate-binding protein